MDIKAKLTELGVEYQAKSRYCTTCPSCSGERKKSNARCLLVSLTSSSISLKCMHSSNCEYQEGVHIKELSNNDTIEVQELLAAPIKEGDLPPIDETRETYWHSYYDDFNQLVMYIQRTYFINAKGERDKMCFPWFKTEAGDWFRNKPTNVTKFLYGQEKLSKDKPVLVFEGELKTDIASELLPEFDCVSWPFGANNVKSCKWELLTDRVVYLWADNNTAGQLAMQEVANHIDSQKVFLLDATLLPKDADIADIKDDKDLILKVIGSKVNISKPILNGIFSLDDWDSAFADGIKGDAIGFPEMDKVISYPASGLVVVAGRIFHGKSALMVNMAANLLRNTSSIVVVGTYEVPTNVWLGRLLQVLDGKRYKTVDMEDIIHYDDRMKARADDDKEVQEIRKYIRQGRLIVTDNQNKAESLLTYMEKLKNSVNKVYTIIDYIQILPTDMFKNRQRYMEIKDIVEKFRALANEYKQVVIMGSQLTNGNTPYEDQAKESKAVRESAELFLKVFNKNDTTSKRRDKDGLEKGDHYENVQGEFIIDVNKSRIAGGQFYFGLTFSNCSALKEVNKNEF